MEKMGLEVIIKHMKVDNDAMLDEINAKLIDVCGNYLEWKKLPWDKYQLATIVMDLYTQTVSELEAPFKVIIKESKTLVQEYLEKNKSKREALERIKKENDALDKEIIERNKEIILKKEEMNTKRSVEYNNPETVEVEDVPKPVRKPKQQRRKWTDALAIDSFTLPI